MQLTPLLGAVCACTIFTFTTSAYSAAFSYGAVTSIYNDGAGNLTEWLHLDQTANMSVSDVDALLGAGGLYEGYRYATEAEVGAVTIALFGWHFPDDLIINTSPVIRYANDGKTAELSSFFGASLIDGNNTYVYGITADMSGGSYLSLELVDADNASPGWDYYSGDVFVGEFESSPFRGHFLVQTVPVPASAWLFGSGLLGLIGITKKARG